MSGPKYHFDIAQGSAEWDEIRAGKWSASRAGTIMGGLNTKGLDDLIMDIAWGRVYGPIEHGTFKSAAMERGNNLEQDTRDRYEFLKSCDVTECGFVEHATIPHVGWSPDGLVQSADGRWTHGIEAKNPLHKAYMRVKQSGLIPAEYRWQVRWGMWVGELETEDFLVDHPKAGLIVIPCELTDSERDQMAARVALLEPRVAEWIDIITNKRNAA